MPFGLNEAHLFYVFAAVSVVLAAEAVYLLLFSATSYRSRVNRRLRLMNDRVDRQAILVQLRRERGLSGSGDFRLPIVYLNRLVLQSGLSVGLTRFALAIALGALILEEVVPRPAMAGIVLVLLGAWLVTRAESTAQAG